MEKPAHPLEQLMTDKNLTNEVLAAMVEKPHRPIAESIRHIRQGHRRPSWELAFAIGRAFFGNDAVAVLDVATKLRDRRHYPKPTRRRSRASKKHAA